MTFPLALIIIGFIDLLFATTIILVSFGPGIIMGSALVFGTAEARVILVIVLLSLPLLFLLSDMVNGDAKSACVLLSIMKVNV